MARRTLYPTTPGETAIDRLLNQTLPNILKEERARQEREELREEEKNRYAAEFQYRVQRDTKTDIDNFTSDFNGYYLQAMKDMEGKNYDGGSIHILEKHVSDSKFATESQLGMVKTLKANLQNGKEFSDKIDFNTKTINSYDATKIQKFNAYVNNLEYLSSYGTQTQKSDFEKSISEAGNPSLAFINANRNHLGVITGMDSKINEAFRLSDAIESGMNFNSMDSDSKEAFLPYLSPADQERFKNPFGDSPNYQTERNAALRAAYMTSSKQILNQEGQTFLESTIATYGGQENFVFSMQELKDNEPVIFRNFMEKFARAGELSTRGTPGRLEAASKGATPEERIASEQEFITQHMENNGYPRSLFDKEEKEEDFDTTDVQPFKSTYEGLSNREVIKVISEGDFTKPILGDVEQYFISRIEEFNSLKTKMDDPEIAVLESQKNEFNRLRQLISKFPYQYKKLTDERYLQKRGAGKYVARQTGADTNTYPYSSESFKRTTPVVKNGLKIVKTLEENEASIEALRNTLKTALIEGDRYVVTDPVALKGLRVAGLKKGRGTIIKRFTADTINKAISRLEKQIVEEEKKLPQIVNTLKTKFDLFKDYKLVEIINQGEDLSARDISYMIMPKNN